MAAWKPVVLGIIAKRPQLHWQILSQVRIVQNQSYDPLYNRTHEVMGETLKEGENVLDALRRGIAEECGNANQRDVIIVGTAAHRRARTGSHGERDTWTTGKGDTIVCAQPICFVQQMGPPQPWLGPAFLVRVPGEWEPDHTKSDGEAGEPKWWNPTTLMATIDKKPGEFMGLHMPALRLVAEKLAKANADEDRYYMPPGHP